ncbi:Lipoprotein signal peptidase [hydrothermal vent metagenome]|uniref:Lipoprotein signal peptidase n=1 Tax=hydrothermal vent metagenome TaxID=652676 RepID=A0A3B1B5A5_9ZZZZ
MLRWLWLSVAVIVLDIATKLWAEASLVPYISQTVIPFFDLTLMYNKGAAFSFLSDQGGWQRWFLTTVAAVVTIVLVRWLAMLKSHEWLVAVALSLVIGGAVGNLIDRVSYGHVIDFIDVYYVAGSCLPFFAALPIAGAVQCHWPAFNIADSAISVGVVVMLVDAFFGEQGEER